MTNKRTKNQIFIDEVMTIVDMSQTRAYWQGYHDAGGANIVIDYDGIIRQLLETKLGIKEGE